MKLLSVYRYHVHHIYVVHISKTCSIRMLCTIANCKIVVWIAQPSKQEVKNVIILWKSFDPLILNLQRHCNSFLKLKFMKIWANEQNDTITNNYCLLFSNIFFILCTVTILLTYIKPRNDNLITDFNWTFIFDFI